MNTLWLSLLRIGTVLIGFGETLSAEIGASSAYLLPAPAALVLVYATVVGVLITRPNLTLGRTYVEHHIQSIYHAGFLFTLVALTALFL